MKIKLTRILIWSLLSALFATIHLNAQQDYETNRVYLSGYGPSDAVDWSFYCTSGRKSGFWTEIPVPSHWEQHGFGNYNYGHDLPKHDEEGIYQTRFFAPEEWKNKAVRLVFEGSMTDTSIKINGQPIGSKHQGGYDRFHYLLTDTGRYDQHSLKFGQENELEVSVAKVSANQSLEQAERKADYWVFGGIYRPVYLEVLPKEFIHRVAIDAKADGTITMDVFPQIHRPRKNDFPRDHVDRIVAQIETLEGEPVGEPFSAQLSGNGQARVRLAAYVASPKLWSPENPNLYQVRTHLKLGDQILHEKVQRFGFRTFELREGDGLYLNERKIRMRGVNRNVFRPDTGRAVDRDEARQDAMMIKEMNANAVRSHLPPTTAFMEACDELGLLVILELTTWQRPVIDAPVARKIAHSLVTNYQNHPSLVIWANGNEGGFNLEVDELFDLLDLQRRPIIHPWAIFGGIDTLHYPEYTTLLERLSRDTLYLPTEFLHGLYDGGHGAGLEDYWEAILESPVGAGGFLWCWADAAIERTDRNGQLDTDGNHSADGILGPYGEKEASYSTIREIWSPVQIAMDEVTERFDGIIPVENRFLETNLNQCSFEWELVSFANPYKSLMTTQVGSGQIIAPSIQPEASGSLKLNLPADWSEADALRITALDPHGEEIMQWSWDIPKDRTWRTEDMAQPRLIKGDEIEVVKGDIVWKFSKDTGQLLSIKKDGRDIGLRNGPIVYAATIKEEIKMQHEWEVTTESSAGNVTITASSRADRCQFRWHFQNGQSGIELSYRFIPPEDPLLYHAVGFDLEDSDVLSKRWLGDGPFRIWNNRRKGPQFGLWENDFNDGLSGERWELPEFKGVFGNVNWMQLRLRHGIFLVIDSTEEPDVGILRPYISESSANAKWAWPAGGGLYIFHKTPAVGTKFKKADRLGPQSMPEFLNDPIEGYLRISIQ